MIDLRTIVVPKYEPLYPYVTDLIPRRIAFFENMNVLDAIRQGYKVTIPHA